MADPGVGLGFRRDISSQILSTETGLIDFVEFAPENWMGIGGYWYRVLRQITEKFPVTTHGLSLSLGSPEPLDWDFLKRLKSFLDEIGATIYSEHLSYAKCDNAHLYELLPIPFREDAIAHIVQRIQEVQDFLERKIAIENVSYYTPVAPEMDEATFIGRIAEEADCHLLLDVNNVYVNAFNHQYDAKEYIEKLPLERVSYIHMAGHTQESEDLIIDTHGEPVIDPVFELFEWTLERVGSVPVLLERDYNFPEFEELKEEIQRLKSIMAKRYATQG